MHVRHGLVMLVPLLSACGPVIHSFAVAPARGCLGDTVSVTYDVRGTGTLHVAPPRVGEKTDTTRYQLVVTKGSKVVQAAQDVLIYRGADLDTLVLGPSTKLGADSIRVQQTLREDLWPSFVTIRTIASASGRPIRVTHNGKISVVEVQSVVTGLDGLPVSGDWDLRAARLPNEQFGTPGRSPPDRLRLQVLLQCSHTGAMP